jgi:hypothetical protein
MPARWPVVAAVASSAGALDRGGERILRHAQRLIDRVSRGQENAGGVLCSPPASYGSRVIGERTAGRALARGSKHPVGGVVPAEGLGG